MTDTVRVRRAQATGVVKLSDEQIGDATDDDTCDVTGKIVVQWSFLADF